MHSVKLNIKINFWTHSDQNISSVVPYFNQGLLVFTLDEKYGKSSQKTLNKHRKYPPGSLATLNVSKELSVSK